MCVHVGEETPEIDLYLDVEQGFCDTAEKLLMIVHEFCSIYLECEHVHESHSCIVSSASQLLCDLHKIMDTKEKEEVAQFVSQFPSILIILLLAVSTNRKCKLQLHYVFVLSNTSISQNRYHLAESAPVHVHHHLGVSINTPD